MLIEKSDLAADVGRFCVVVDCSFLLAHEYFADRNNEVNIYYINLVECYADVFIDIQKKINTSCQDLAVFSSEPSLIMLELR
jgi:hypothetical protein